MDIVQPARWMEQLVKSVPGAAELPLGKLYIPGTHDSGTWALSNKSELLLEVSEGALAAAVAQLNSLPFIGNTVKEVAAKWSRTQSQDMRGQLENGVRCV